jgi:hypothetical protein
MASALEFANNALVERLPSGKKFEPTEPGFDELARSVEQPLEGEVSFGRTLTPLQPAGDDTIFLLSAPLLLTPGHAKPSLLRPSPSAPSAPITLFVGSRYACNFVVARGEQWIRVSAAPTPLSAAEWDDGTELHNPTEVVQGGVVGQGE